LFTVSGYISAGALRGLLIVGVVLSLVACKKPDEDLGLDLLPGNPLGTTVETTSLRAFTVEDTVVRTSGLSRQLLGSYVDPQFGTVKAGLVAQIRLSVNNVGLGQDNSGLVADSIVLALPFDGANTYYGNLDPQVFEVYEITDDLSVDSLYYSDRVPGFSADDLVADRGGSITPRPTLRPVVGSDTLAPQLRIRLSNELAGRFLAAFGTSVMTDNTAFLQFFKGLYVTVNNGPQLPFEQGVLYFNLLNTASKVTLYYKDTVSSDPELPRKFDLPINQNSVRYSVTEFDRSTAVDPGLNAALADTSLPAPATYVQAMGGLRTGILLPNIMEFANTNKTLAKAELVLPISGTYNAFLGPPTQLFIFRRDSLGKDVFLPDQLAGIGAINGNYSASERSYRFNITRYVQGLLNGSIPSTGLELVPGSSGVSVNRAVLAGPTQAEGGMHLQLTFTTY
jgi:hypothetical protein